MDSKTKLVEELCAIAATFIACAHRRRLSTRKPPFIDWYLILKVDVDAGVDVIRRQYHQLALQLHPDKNKHPDAEVAFKLVLEAYTCLSNKAKRASFDSARREKLCNKCSAHIEQQTLANKVRNNSRTQQSQCEKPRSKRVPNALREVRKRLEEELAVISSCLRAWRASPRSGIPPFDPSSHLVFPNYPHCRARAISEGHGPLSALYDSRIRGHTRRKGLESPIYELKTT